MFLSINDSWFPIHVQSRSFGPGAVSVSVSLSLCVQVPSSLLPRLPLSQDGSGLLGEQEAEAFLEQDPVSGELVVWGEAGRVSRAGGLPVGFQLLSAIKEERERSVELDE